MVCKLVSGEVDEKRRVWLRSGSALLAMAAAGAWPVASAAQPAARPRLVSVGAGVTEIVFALGAQAQLVGIDSSSIYPPAAHALPKIGYQRTLTSEGVISLAPQVLLAGTEAGPPPVLKQVAAAGIRVVPVLGDFSFPGLVERVKVVAAATGHDAQGERLLADLTREWAAQQARIKAAPLRNAAGQPLKVAFIMRHGATVMAAGRNTAADAMLRLVGANNAFGDSFENYKPLSAEALAQVAPDAIVGTYDGVLNPGDRERFLGTPGLSLTPAGRDRKVALMDIVLLLGFGPRLPQAVGELYDALRA